MVYQTTILKSVHCSGVGLHTGKKVTLTLRPSFGGGIVFRRIDLDQSPEIKATSEFVKSTFLATSLESEGVIVRTIEHLMAALHAMGIDNILVELDGEEIPIMDGSAISFVYLLHQAGKKIIRKPKMCIKIKRRICVSSDEGRKICINPYKGFRVNCMIGYNHVLLKQQSLDIEINENTFCRQIASARTFGFLKDVEALRKKGLAKGGSLDNAIVINDYCILNREGLRFKDEFVRHKILDIIGDMYLCGYPLMGYVIAHKSGHELHHLLTKEIIENRGKWELVPYPIAAPLSFEALGSNISSVGIKTGTL